MTVYETLMQTFTQLLSGFTYLVGAIDDFLIDTSFSMMDLLIIVLITKIITKFLLPVIVDVGYSNKEASESEK